MRNKGVSMITLIITIIVIIILSAIAFFAITDATASAQFSKFASEFGDYADNFKSGPVSNVTESLSISNKVANNAQKIYCAARMVDLKAFEQVLNGITVPGGYTTPRFQTDIKDATGALKVLASSTTPVYEIKDNVMKEYTDKKFYGDSNGKETHWVTADGTVFTIPGFPRIVDSENRMYITPDLYYISTDGDMITHNDLIPIEPVRSLAGILVGTQIYPEASDSIQDIIDESIKNIKVGDYVSYTPDVEANVKWRVWDISDKYITIIPAKPVGKLRLGDSDTSNLDRMRIKTLEDYLSAKTKIKNLCQEYTCDALGVTEASIRSLTLSDLEDEKISGLKSQRLASEARGEYGKIVEYLEGSFFAETYNAVSGRNDLTTTFKTAPTRVQHTYYESEDPQWKNASESSVSYGSILGNTEGWLPDTYANCTNAGTYFGLYVIESDRLIGYSLLLSHGETISIREGVRPLISINKSLLKVDTDNPGDGTANAPWNIYK